MSGYLLGVIGVVLISSLLTVVIPQGKTAKLVASLSKLACIVAILMPIPALLSGKEQSFFGETIIQTDDEYIKYLSEMRVREAESNLAAILRESYGDELEVALYWAWEGMDGEAQIHIYAASVYCSRLTDENRREISKLMQDTYGIEATFL